MVIYCRNIVHVHHTSILYQYWPTPHVILAFTLRECSTCGVYSETVSFSRTEFGELQSLFSRMLAVLSDLDWWIARVSSLVMEMQPQHSHNENLPFLLEIILRDRFSNLADLWTSCDSYLLPSLMELEERMAIYQSSTLKCQWQPVRSFGPVHL